MYVGKDRRSGSLTAEDADGPRGGHDKASPSTAQTAARAAWRDGLCRVLPVCGGTRFVAAGPREPAAGRQPSAPAQGLPGGARKEITIALDSGDDVAWNTSDEG